MRALPWVLLLAVGCGEKEPEEEDTGVSENTTTTPTESDPLKEGTYPGTVNATVSNGCGVLGEGLGVAPLEVVWTGDEAFDLLFNASDITDMSCTLDGEDAANCSSFAQTFEYEGYAVDLEGVPASVAIVSKKSFDVEWEWTFSCPNGDCTNAGTTDPISYPCVAELDASYTK